MFHLPKANITDWTFSGPNGELVVAFRIVSKETSDWHTVIETWDVPRGSRIARFETTAAVAKLSEHRIRGTNFFLHTSRDGQAESALDYSGWGIAPAGQESALRPLGHMDFRVLPRSQEILAWGFHGFLIYQPFGDEKPEPLLAYERVAAVAIDPSERWFATVSQAWESDGADNTLNLGPSSFTTLRVWNKEKMEPLFRAKLSGSWLPQLAFSASGDSLFLANGSAIHVLQMDLLEELSNREIEGHCEPLEPPRENRRVV